MELGKNAFVRVIRSSRTLGGATLIASLALSVSSTALAQGSNSTATAAPLSSPTAVNPSTNQVTGLGNATCVQQYNDWGISLEQTSQDVAIAQTAADSVGLALEVSGLASSFVSSAGAVPGVTAQGVALGLGIADLFNQQTQINLANEQNGLPYCEQGFAGTISVSAGGSNISGDSIYNNNLAVREDVNVEGNVTASQVQTTQGISTNGGGIIIGDPNLTTFSSGITLGGGALSGAGYGGAQAYTGDVTAIAIGNSAQATSVNSTAMGTSATATATGASAFGSGATASGTNSAAFGTGATASGASSVASGSSATASGTNSAAFGTGATASLENQQVFGTANETYAMRGITSNESRNRQSGLLEVTTTDALGNLASDGGATFTAIAASQAGIAISLALEAPDLATGENFGIRMGWGNFDGKAQALGISAIAVLERDLFVNGDRLTINGGIGYGRSDFMNYEQHDVIAGRIGLQWSW